VSRGRYLVPRRLADLDGSLSSRDHAILSTLGRLHVATAHQLARLHCTDFPSPSAARQCRRVLAELVRRRCIARLERQIGGVRAGSRGYVYGLDLAGHKLLRTPGRPRRPFTPALSFLAHRIATGEIFVRLIEAERAGRLELTAFEAEPECWRWFSGPTGPFLLKPDALATVAVGADEAVWWLEIDRGTEAAPVLDHKLDAYRLAWQSGQLLPGLDTFPRVLWVVPSEARHAVLVDACGRQPADSWPLFAVTTFEHAVATLRQGAVA
jgi:Replication-relaxation